ncbi:14844_t:CDS:1, partial [Cetraspora pellucida]
NQISTDPTYVIELNQMTNDCENARAPIVEAIKRLTSSSKNGTACLVSIGGTTLVSEQFGSIDQTFITSANSSTMQDIRGSYLQDNGNDLSSSVMRAWLVKKPLRRDLRSQ